MFNVDRLGAKRFSRLSRDAKPRGSYPSLFRYSPKGHLMPSVMIRKNAQGKLTLYVAKRDLEEDIVSLEHDNDEQWGGQVTLADGTAYYLEPMSPPKLPITLRAKKMGGDD
jgi:nitrogen fixation protein NifT